MLTWSAGYILYIILIRIFLQTGKAAPADRGGSPFLQLVEIDFLSIIKKYYFEYTYNIVKYVL